MKGTSPFKPLSIRPAQGGRLATDVSTDQVGLENYRVKRDWRRFNDREIRREGYDYYRPNPLEPVGNQPLNAKEPITLIHTARFASGKTVQIAATPTTIYRSFSLEDGQYVSDVTPNELYIDPSAAGFPYFTTTDYILENQFSSPYFDPNATGSPYFQDTFEDWSIIGSGFSAAGNRWEVVDTGDDVVFNNGVDLPVVYSANEYSVTPMYEMREQGIVSVGTIVNFNSVLMCFDVTQIKSNLPAGFTLGYGPIDPSLTDRIKYRAVWSALGKPRRWAATVSCSMELGSREVKLLYAAQSWSNGQAVIVVGAGLNGGNLLANIVFGAGTTTLILDQPALTAVTNTELASQDMIGSIVGFQDLVEDGSVIIKAMELNGTLVIYRATGYQLAQYVGDPGTPFSFPKMVPTANSLFYKNTLITVTMQGYNFHVYAGRNSFYRFDMISRMPTESWAHAEFSWGGPAGADVGACRRTFYDQAALGDIIPGADAISRALIPPTSVYDGSKKFTVTGLAIGQEYQLLVGTNETGNPINGTVLLPSGNTTFTASASTLILSSNTAGVRVTATIVAFYRRSDFIFSATNEMTKEVFVYFPSLTEDKAICFDYEQGTLSTTSADASSAETLIVNDNQKFFVMGTLRGILLTYGKSDMVQPNWTQTTKGSSMWNRIGFTYKSELYSGLGAFGVDFHEKEINAYVLQMSSLSPDTAATVELYGATNPNAPTPDPDQRGEHLLASQSLSAGDNLFPVHFENHYFADRIIVDGKDNPCEISARTYNVAVVASSSQVRSA